MSRIARSLRRINTAGLVVRLLALWKLVRHAATPRAARLVALFTVAYAVSPIDLIPDFIPVLGLLDDLVLLPLGIWLVMRLTPTPLWQARLAEAERDKGRLPRLLWGAVLVVMAWLALLGLLAWWLLGSAAGH